MKLSIFLVFRKGLATNEARMQMEVDEINEGGNCDIGNGSNNGEKSQRVVRRFSWSGFAPPFHKRGRRPSADCYRMKKIDEE